MSTAPVASASKGWCPALATPMLASDGLLVRVKPTAGRIPADAAAALARACARFGNGRIDLTMRANLQVRGLRAESAKAFAEVALAHGLGHAEVQAEAIRNVTVDPLGADDPGAAFDSHVIARALEARLCADHRFWQLPPKFGFVIDGGRTLPIGDATGDVYLRMRADELLLSCDRGRLAATCAPGRAVEAAGRLALAFLEMAESRVPGCHRMRDLVAAGGETDLFAEAGLAPDRTLPGPATPPGAAALYAAAPPGAPFGFVPVGDGKGVMVARAPAGWIGADALGGAATLAERFGDGIVRTTPWRALALAGVTRDAARPLAGALEEIGFETACDIAACVTHDAAIIAGGRP